MATNRAEPRIDAKAAPYSEDLQRVFGYNSFEVIGSQARTISDSSEQWLIPSRQFYLKLHVHPGAGVSRVYAELYEADHLLLGLEAELVPGKPLFIRGPQWGNGQIVLLLTSGSY